MASDPEVIVPQQPPFVDARGEIQNLIDGQFGSALVMRSVKGAVRGNHYHKTDFHYCWLQQGGLIYAHRPVGSTGNLQEWRIKSGQIFYTPPMHEHVMYFTEDSIVFVVARNHRGMAHYESDTVRVTPLQVAGTHD